MKCLLCSSPLEGRGCKSGDVNVNADSTSTLVLRVLPWPFIWMCIFIFFCRGRVHRELPRECIWDEWRTPPLAPQLGEGSPQLLF